VRAPGSNVTLAAETRLGSRTGKSGSMRTVPVKYPVILCSMVANPHV
jgi:hypothetical protein